MLRLRIAALRLGVAVCGWVMGEVNTLGARWSALLRHLEARR